MRIRDDYLSDDELYAKQERFLLFFGLLGSSRPAADKSHVDIRTVQKWKVKDTLGFKARYQEAAEEYGDLLEGVLHDHIMGLKPGQDILGLIFRLKAD